MGSLHPDGGPTGIFRCKGGEFIAIMVLPYQWPQMIRAMNMPALANDPRFSTPRARRDNNESLKHIIEQWLSQFPTREAALKLSKPSVFPVPQYWH
jgi:CoA:oxalate CoA-transferase